MGKVRWTEESERWLRDIYDYIAQDNPNAAQRVVAGIYDRAQFLARFPKSGYIFRLDPNGEIRIHLYGHYRIAYLLRKNKRVEILGVFHGALDIDRYLS
jgi:toxin ParE1/3/4